MTDTAFIQSWTIDPPEQKAAQAIERIAEAPDVSRVAIMPDVHVGVGVSNGVVVATRQLVYPAAVGGDIGCGYSAVPFDSCASGLTRRRAAECVLNVLPTCVPITRHRRRDGLPELDFESDSVRLSEPELIAKSLKDGREELGTLGRGNHFLEFQEDDDGRLWVMVHSGSRAMGQHITAYHLRNAESVGAGLAWLDTASEQGLAYLNDVAWARRYASASRRIMLEQAAEVAGEVLSIQADFDSVVDTDHSHVQRETHDGCELWVHRKGANTAKSGEINMIPGSMATHTFHVEGRGNCESMSSSSHGAGRRMSRSAARAKIRRKDLQRQLQDVWVNPKIASRLSDESPAAYKDVDAVMRAQRSLVRKVRRLRPLLSHKGL